MFFRTRPRSNQTGRTREALRRPRSERPPSVPIGRSLHLPRFPARLRPYAFRSVVSQTRTCRSCGFCFAVKRNEKMFCNIFCTAGRNVTYIVAAPERKRLSQNRARSCKQRKEIGAASPFALFPFPSEKLCVLREVVDGRRRARFEECYDRLSSFGTAYTWRSSSSLTSGAVATKKTVREAKRLQVSSALFAARLASSQARPHFLPKN